MEPISIDGSPIKEVIAPQSPAEIASVLAEAGSQRRAVTPLGGGTKLALGNIPDFVDLGVSTAGINRVLHYEPTDMTLSVEAGVRFDDLSRVLAERGQRLPIDVVDSDNATIGGLIATALAGPRRYGSGTLRDLLIGISVAYPSGIVGKGGGLVVKNVTGFDLMRLHLGALGTLGIVTSANFKVLPRARAEATLQSAPGSLTAALAAAEAAKSSRLRPVAIEVISTGADWSTAIRLEGRPETVALGVDAILHAGSWQVAGRNDESEIWWKETNQRQRLSDPGRVVMRFGTNPRKTGELAQAVTGQFARNDISLEFWAVSPGLGTVIAVVDAGSLSAEKLAALQKGGEAEAETVTILSAPAELKRGLDVWGKCPETIEVMRSLKTEFDGGRMLNPGRFVDRI